MATVFLLMLWFGGAMVRKDNWRQELFWPYYLGRYISMWLAARKDTPDEH